MQDHMKKNDPNCLGIWHEISRQGPWAILQDHMKKFDPNCLWIWHEISRQGP